MSRRRLENGVLLGCDCSSRLALLREDKFRNVELLGLDDRSQRGLLGLDHGTIQRLLGPDEGVL